MARLAVLAALLLANACTSYQQAEKALPSWPRVSVAGGELEYSVTGVGEPLLLIHGSGYADAFGGLQTHPALSNYQMIVYHRRGHGGSSRATSRTVAITCPAPPPDAGKPSSRARWMRRRMLPLRVL